MIGLFAVPLFVYTGLLVYLIRGAARLRGPRRPPEEWTAPFLSVVVPLRNEAVAAPQTLRALARQDYRGDWEVICVNDRSTDDTPGILEAFCRRHARFSSLSISREAPVVPSPKKRALQAGFEKARGDILLTTDADCLPPPGWLRSMAECFTPDVGIVQGGKTIEGPEDAVTRYQQMEVFGFVCIEAACFAQHRPWLASAPSLAYRRSLFEAAGGFGGLEKLVSGDDDMLVHKMSALGRSKLVYNPSTEARVPTRGVDTWKDLFFQRARWSSNGLRYRDKILVAVLAGLFGFYLWLLAGPVLVWLGWARWEWWFGAWMVKFAGEFHFLRRMAAKLGCAPRWRDLWWVELVHVPVTVVAVLMGQAGWYKWK